LIWGIREGYSLDGYIKTLGLLALVTRRNHRLTANRAQPTSRHIRPRQPHRRKRKQLVSNLSTHAGNVRVAVTTPAPSRPRDVPIPHLSTGAFIQLIPQDSLRSTSGRGVSDNASGSGPGHQVVTDESPATGPLEQSALTAYEGLHVSIADYPFYIQRLPPAPPP
jgi:hypothetical protein